MSALWMIIAFAFVLVVLAVVVLGLFEATWPVLQRGQSRDPRTGKRWESPHLERWDEFERSHEGKSPHLESPEEFERTHPA
jgi:flagellar biosynthesis/type III secretory pathway M-ring protein FliF/YscJ